MNFRTWTCEHGTSVDTLGRTRWKEAFIRCRVVDGAAIIDVIIHHDTLAAG